MGQKMKELMLIPYPRTGGTFLKMAILQICEFDIISDHCGTDKLYLNKKDTDSIINNINKKSVITILRNPINSTQSLIAMEYKTNNKINKNNVLFTVENRIKNYFNFFSLIQNNKNNVTILNFETLINQTEKYINLLAKNNNIKCLNAININEINNGLIINEKNNSKFYRTSSDEIFYHELKPIIEKTEIINKAYNLYNNLLLECLDF